MRLGLDLKRLSLRCSWSCAYLTNVEGHVLEGFSMRQPGETACCPSLVCTGSLPVTWHLPASFSEEEEGPLGGAGGGHPRTPPTTLSFPSSYVTQETRPEYLPRATHFPGPGEVGVPTRGPGRVLGPG